MDNEIFIQKDLITEVMNGLKRGRLSHQTAKEMAEFLIMSQPPVPIPQGPPNMESPVYMNPEFEHAIKEIRTMKRRLFTVGPTAYEIAALEYEFERMVEQIKNG